MPCATTRSPVVGAYMAASALESVPRASEGRARSTGAHVALNPRHWGSVHVASRSRSERPHAIMGRPFGGIASEG